MIIYLDVDKITLAGVCWIPDSSQASEKSAQGFRSRHKTSLLIHLPLLQECILPVSSGSHGSPMEEKSVISYYNCFTRLSFNIMKAQHLKCCAFGILKDNWLRGPKFWWVHYTQSIPDSSQASEKSAQGFRSRHKTSLLIHLPLLQECILPVSSGSHGSPMEEKSIISYYNCFTRLSFNIVKAQHLKCCAFGILKDNWLHDPKFGWVPYTQSNLGNI